MAKMQPKILDQHGSINDPKTKKKFHKIKNEIWKRRFRCRFKISPHWYLAAFLLDSSWLTEKVRLRQCRTMAVRRSILTLWGSGCRVGDQWRPGASGGRGVQAHPGPCWGPAAHVTRHRDANVRVPGLTQEFVHCLICLSSSFLSNIVEYGEYLKLWRILVSQTSSAWKSSITL